MSNNIIFDRATLLSRIAPAQQVSATWRPHYKALADRCDGVLDELDLYLEKVTLSPVEKEVWSRPEAVFVKNFEKSAAISASAVDRMMAKVVQEFDLADSLPSLFSWSRRKSVRKRQILNRLIDFMEDQKRKINAFIDGQRDLMQAVIIVKSGEATPSIITTYSNIEKVIRKQIEEVEELAQKLSRDLRWFDIECFEYAMRHIELQPEIDTVEFSNLSAGEITASLTRWELDDLGSYDFKGELADRARRLELLDRQARQLIESVLNFHPGYELPEGAQDND